MRKHKATSRSSWDFKPRDCKYVAKVRADSSKLTSLFQAADEYANGSDRWAEVQPGYLGFHFESHRAYFAFRLHLARCKLELLVSDQTSAAEKSATRAEGTVAHNTEKIICRFIGDFKVGDNLVRNANALCRLDETNDAGIFNKLIVVQAGSITEASLQQIIYRAQNFNREGVVNIPEEDRLAIAEKEIEKFAVIIDVMKKHKVLNGLGERIYDDLHKLREYRNKVHIQLDVKGASRDEDVAFSDAICIWALKFMVQVLKHLNEVYPRPEDLARYATPLVVPSPQ